MWSKPMVCQTFVNKSTLFVNTASNIHLKLNSVSQKTIRMEGPNKIGPSVLCHLKGLKA